MSLRLEKRPSVTPRHPGRGALGIDNFHKSSGRLVTCPRFAPAACSGVSLVARAGQRQARVREIGPWR